MTDDSSSYDVCTEQSSSASYMTAAEVMDVIPKLPGCAGQEADAVSAYMKVKMEHAPVLLKLPKSKCPDIWIRLPRHKCPKSWSNIEEPVVSHDRNLYGHPLTGLLWERPIRECSIKARLGKNFQLGNALFLHLQKVFRQYAKVERHLCY